MGFGTFIIFLLLRTALVLFVFSAGLPLWMRCMGTHELSSKREMAPVVRRLAIGFGILSLLLALEALLLWNFGWPLWGRYVGLILGLQYTGVLTLAFAFAPLVLALRQARLTVEKELEAVRAEIETVGGDNTRFAERMLDENWSAEMHRRLDTIERRLPSWMQRPVIETRQQLSGLQGSLTEEIHLLRARRSLESGDLNAGLRHVLSWNPVSLEALLLHLENTDYTAAQADLQAGCVANELLALESYQLIADQSSEAQRLALAEKAFRKGILSKRRYAIMQLRNGGQQKAVELMEGDVELRHWSQMISAGVSIARHSGSIQSQVTKQVEL